MVRTCDCSLGNCFISIGVISWSVEWIAVCWTAANWPRESDSDGFFRDCEAFLQEVVPFMQYGSDSSWRFFWYAGALFIHIWFLFGKVTVLFSCHCDFLNHSHTIAGCSWVNKDSFWPENSRSWSSTYANIPGSITWWATIFVFCWIRSCWGK